MRLVPKQAPLGVSPWWGFLHENRIWRWASLDEAYIGATNLGVSPNRIAVGTTLYPKADVRGLTLWTGAKIGAKS